MAAFGGLISSLGTNTADFSQRLKKRPRNTDAEALKRHVSKDDPGEVDLKKGITSKQFYHLAYRMAAKSYEEDLAHNLRKPRSRPTFTVIREKVAAKKAKGGRGYQVTSATAHYVCDLAATGAKGKPSKLIADNC
jgi:sterol 3beta-glucosyltransferase